MSQTFGVRETRDDAKPQSHDGTRGRPQRLAVAPTAALRSGSPTAASRAMA
jgi:hypothetical protein